MKHDSNLHRHLDEAGETYLQHWVFTIRMSLSLIYAGVILFIHGLLPFLFTHKASGLIDRINTELAARKAACEARRKSNFH